MAGIAGIASTNETQRLTGMLERMRHRGKTGLKIWEKSGTTLGIIWNEQEYGSIEKFIERECVGYYFGPGHFASAEPEEGSFILKRDPLGLAPLYYGFDNSGIMYFASEIKALNRYFKEIKELTPGYWFNGSALQPSFKLVVDIGNFESINKTANKLRKKLGEIIEKCIIDPKSVGSWLSGGLDSSVICAIASKFVNRIKTFSAGVKNAPDLYYAKEMSRFIGSEHHEIVVTEEDLIKALPEVIYHLESFDALLVRSSLTNYLAAKEASNYVGEVFSGEGGDEIFAGYLYLKTIPIEKLNDELLDITGRLHNTALQRVDRCASANGTIVHVPFINPEILKMAFSIPAEYKVRNNIEKWILRKAMADILPEKVLNRTKAKFWEGAGVKDLILRYAEGKIKDSEFLKERILDNGHVLNSKEELLYYRIFVEQFGRNINLSWMGRTKNISVA
ncbi:MAG: asparagine synthase-related protein [Bacteroidales bacterium]